VANGALPPRLAERVLGWLLGPAPSARFVVGDLREEYGSVRARRPAWQAWAWYWAIVLRTGCRARWEAGRSERLARRSVAVRYERNPTTGDIMRFELKQALRFLMRRPGFSGAIVLTVALAIAATTVAYAVMDGVLLERMPYSEPDRLAVIWEHNIPRDRVDNVVSPSNFLAWRERATSFERLAAAIAFSTTVTGVGEPERVGGVDASPELFEMIGATPLVGRLYGRADDSPEAEAVVVLSEGYWRRRFGADPAVVGSTVRINENPFTVVGVLPEQYDVPIAAEFGGTGTHELWTPPAFPPQARTATGRYLQVFGQLKPGVSLEAARAEMHTIAEQLRQEFPERQAGWDVTVLSLQDEVVGDVSTLVLIVFGAVCLVLLIACGNVANLLLTRATARQQEMAVRTALGAGRGRLVRQLLLESVALSATGGLLGLLLAYWAVRALIATAPDIPRIETLGMDASVIAFALLATVGTALLFGLAPALHIVGGNVAGWLKERGAGIERRSGNVLRGGLVVAQVALSLILLVGAGLLIRSFANRVDRGIGFDMERMLTAEIQLPGARYDSAGQIRFFEEVVERLHALPGVTAASAITFAPLAGAGSATSFWPADRPEPQPGEHPVTDVRWIQRDYHRALGIPLVEGRYFDETDRADAPLRVILNESGARQLWPGQSAIGKRIIMPWGERLDAEVIGVVRDVLFNGPETDLRPMTYWDHRQFRAFSQMTLMVRTASDPTSVLGAVRGAVQEMDPLLPLYNVRTVEGLYDDVLARPRFATVSLGAFAALGLLLAAIGIYGVIAYVTQQRSREIGIRLALGADRASVLRMVVRQGALLVGFALAIGAAGALALTRFLQGMVFDVSTTDPVTFAAMAALLAGIGLVACWIPAYRASTIDPVEAIRYEG
jgi:putative ABC transport system permease protein